MDETTERDHRLTSAPDATGWVENFFWLAFDQESSIGWALHLASLPHDHGLVRQTTVLFLPGGDVAVDLAVGRASDVADRVSGPTADATCVTPFRTWSLRVDTTAQRASVGALWSGLSHGPRRPLRADLVVTSTTSPWEPFTHDGDEARQDWASQHYQQGVRIVGDVEFDGARRTVDLHGMRDHSRGPRDLTSWTGHTLVSLAFDDGSSVGFMHVRGPGGVTALDAAIVRSADGTARPARVVQAPPDLSEAAKGREDFEVVLDLGDGDVRLSMATPGHEQPRAFVTMLAPNDLVLGLLRDRPDPIHVGWSAVACRWGDVAGRGTLERSTNHGPVSPSHREGDV